MKYLASLVFAGGAVTLGLELSASRLLEPVFGNNQIVWAALIGLVLLYLAVGAWFGGKLADRFPQQQVLEFVLILGSLGVALIPAFSDQVLRWAATGIDTFDAGLLIGALLAILLLLSIPVLLLGTITPWAIRLAVGDRTETGEIVGRLYAIATAGSLVGTFLSVLWLIPAYGTRWTFYLLALLPLLVMTIGTIRTGRRWFPLVALLLVLGLAWWSDPRTSIRAEWDDGVSGTLIYEDESLYNYIAVRQWGSERHLKLNDGVGIHSVYHPDSVLSLGIWDYFLLAPFFRQSPISNPQLSNPQSPISNLLVIGLAAGTVSELYTNLYGPLPITGVELDPQIIAVGERYFAMNQPNLHAIAADGRRWLAAQPATATWDVIAIDAYRPPYIPFHLTTVEFFEIVHHHLSEDGVVAINVGRTATNYALVDALAMTLYQVFPTVYAIDEPGPPDNLSNSLLIAAQHSLPLETIIANWKTSPEHPTEFQVFVNETKSQVRLLQPTDSAVDGAIFTDDHAPVEWVVHRIIWDFMTGG